MGPKRGGTHIEIRRSSRLLGRALSPEPENPPISGPVPEQVEQLYVERPAGAVPGMPTILVDPNSSIHWSS